MRFFPWKKHRPSGTLSKPELKSKGVLFCFFRTLKVFFAVVLFFSHGFYRRVQASGLSKAGSRRSMHRPQYAFLTCGREPGIYLHTSSRTLPLMCGCIARGVFGGGISWPLVSLPCAVLQRTGPRTVPGMPQCARVCGVWHREIPWHASDTPGSRPVSLCRAASGIWHVTMHPSETGGRGVDPRSGPRHATILILFNIFQKRGAKVR